jgi:uncharacterized protein (TIGR02285 family)
VYAPLRSLLLMMLICLPLATPALAKELVWGVVPLPGAFNVRDGELIDGVLLESLQLLEARLPTLQMRYEILPMARIEQRMFEFDRICSSGQLQSADRDRLGYFVPYLLSPPMHVLVRRQTLQQLLIEDGQVSLDWLFANPHLRGALARTRVYPPDIRQRLQQAQAQGLLQSLGGSSAGENLLLMVSHRRLDYIFEYPVIYSEVVRHFSLSEPLVSVPLKESSQMVPLGIYCPRTPWGEAMARRLDQAVREVSAEPEQLLSIFQRWLPPEVFGHYHEQLLAHLHERATLPALPLD